MAAVTATDSIRRLLVASAVMVGAAAGGACAADDELFVPKPTVPTVAPAPSAAEDSEPQPESGPVPGSEDRQPESSRQADEQATGTDSEHASGADDEPVPGSEGQASVAEGPASVAEGEQAAGSDGTETGASEPVADDGPDGPDSGQSREDIRPDGNMFEADVAAEPVLRLDEPVDMAVAPGDDLLWVAERAGRVLRVDTERGEAVETILDITAETEAVGERGLLGIAVTDRWLFANFTDLAGDTRVDAFERQGTGLGPRRRTILFQDQPYSNHNGGDLAFGPDGFLYVGFGDGGSAGDPLDAGQDPTTWLGAVLRIEPTPDGVDPYRVPADNPFAAGGEAGSAGRPEIFLTGVRNPWRFSFDRVADDLWIADVGQDRYEEVTVLLAANGGGIGANLGWRLREGLHAYAGDEPAGHADPVWEYSQDDGCSVTGGFVYRGTAIDDLYGAYVFGDYCTSRLWALQISTGEVEFRDLGVEVPGGSLASFGEDARGELYTLSLNGPIARIVEG